MRSRRTLFAVASVVFLVPGCVAPGPEPSAPPSAAPPAARASASAPPPPSPETTPAPSASAVAGEPTPIADPVFVDGSRSAYTILCESWGGEPPPDDVRCKTAVDLALTALNGEQRAATRRFDVRYGDPCPAAGACARTAGARTIYAISETFDSLVVRVARDPDGNLQVWPPVDGPLMPPGRFTPPATSALDLGPRAPREVRDRTPLPFCGRETQADADDFDAKARRCFLAGIAAWSPVEMIVVERTDSGPVTRLYRFEGRGGIVDYVRNVDGWAASISAISPIRTAAVFVLAPPSEPVALHGP